MSNCALLDCRILNILFLVMQPRVKPSDLKKKADDDEPAILRNYERNKSIRSRATRRRSAKNKSIQLNPEALAFSRWNAVANFFSPDRSNSIRSALTQNTKGTTRRRRRKKRDSLKPSRSKEPEAPKPRPSRPSPKPLAKRPTPKTSEPAVLREELRDALPKILKEPGVNQRNVPKPTRPARTKIKPRSSVPTGFKRPSFFRKPKKKPGDFGFLDSDSSFSLVSEYWEPEAPAEEPAQAVYAGNTVWDGKIVWDGMDTTFGAGNSLLNLQDDSYKIGMMWDDMQYPTIKDFTVSILTTEIPMQDPDSKTSADKKKSLEYLSIHLY